MCINENKIALQQLLGKSLIKNAPPNKTIIVSGAFEDPLDVRSSSPEVDVKHLQSDHEEADTRMILSIVNSPAKYIIVVSQDTDVFVILLANYKHFEGRKVYLLQYSGRERKVTDIGAVVDGIKSNGLDPESIPLLHSLTGCDTTS